MGVGNSSPPTHTTQLFPTTPHHPHCTERCRVLDTDGPWSFEAPQLKDPVAVLLTFWSTSDRVLMITPPDLLADTSLPCGTRVGQVRLLKVGMVRLGYMWHPTHFPHSHAGTPHASHTHMLAPHTLPTLTLWCIAHSPHFPHPHCGNPHSTHFAHSYWSNPHTHIVAPHTPHTSHTRIMASHTRSTLILWHRTHVPHAPHPHYGTPHKSHTHIVVPHNALHLRVAVGFAFKVHVIVLLNVIQIKVGAKLELQRRRVWWGCKVNINKHCKS